MRNILKGILEDATGDAGNLGKRLWPIRTAYHREARALLDQTSRNIIYVEWMDSATTHGWIASEDVDNVTGIGTCCTVGFMVRENDRELVLALNGAIGEKTSPHGDCIAIPKCCITERRQLG